MTHNIRPVLETIDRLYDAVLVPTAWPSALERVVDLLRAEDGFMHTPGSGHGQPTFASVRMEPAQAARYCSPEAADFIVPLLRSLPVGMALSSASVIPDREFENGAFYNEIIRPANTFYSASARLKDSGQPATLLCFCRPRRAGAFDIAEIGALQAILPHLTNALELRRRLGVVEQQSDNLLQLLDRVDVGVFLVDAAAQPCFANSWALRIIGQRDGLTLGASGLLAATPAATQRLRQAIASMAPSNGVAAAKPSISLRLERPSQRPPLLLSLFPIGRQGAALPSVTAPRIAVFVSEPDDCPPIDRDALADAFHLTPREAAIAALLASGHDLKGAAQTLAIGAGTARNHLKHVFEKTHAGSQAQLVALLRGFVGRRGE